MHTRLWAAMALAVAVPALAGCGEEPAPVDASPDAPAGISVSNGRLSLPAVKGNPGAVYFEIKNDGDANRVIRAVSVAGAGNAIAHTADMTDLLQVMVPAGETVKLEPGGQHVMVFDLADTVVAGGEAEVTLTFVGGDKVSFPAAVSAAGDER